jgi:predicted nucleic-acid-binding Zn-ribbon protein
MSRKGKQIMATDQMLCPKCNEPMVQGFILDRGHYSAPMVGAWVEGHPKESFWSGTKAPADKRVPIGAFRCSACGYLELYALAIFKAGK